MTISHTKKDSAKFGYNLLKNRDFSNFTLSFGPPFTPPNHSLSGIRKVMKIYQISVWNCWNSVRNAESQHLMHKGSRGIIVGAVETLGGKRKSGWNSGTIKIDRFLSFTPPTLNANVLFLQVFFLISPCVWPNSGYWCCLFLKNISNIWEVFAPFKYENQWKEK